MASSKVKQSRAARLWGERKAYGNLWHWARALYIRYIGRGGGSESVRGKVFKVLLNQPRKMGHVRAGGSDAYVVVEIFANGEYDKVVSILPKDLKYIVDLGANAGFSLMYWRHHYPHARIVAVEPDPGNVEMCKLNTAGDPPDKVSVYQAAVVGKARELYLDRSGAAWAFHITDTKTASTIPIRTLTLTELLAETNAPHDIDLLKMDIEGAEVEVFAGCADWIHRVRYMVIETHAPYDGTKLLADIANAGAQFEVLDTDIKQPGLSVMLLKRKDA